VGGLAGAVCFAEPPWHATHHTFGLASAPPRAPLLSAFVVLSRPPAGWLAPLPLAPRVLPALRVALRGPGAPRPRRPSPALAPALGPARSVRCAAPLSSPGGRGPSLPVARVFPEFLTPTTTARGCVPTLSSARYFSLVVLLPRMSFAWPSTIRLRAVGTPRSLVGPPRPVASEIWPMNRQAGRARTAPAAALIGTRYDPMTWCP